MNKLLVLIIIVLSGPLIILNWVAGIIAILWLFTAGDWLSAVVGVVISLIGHFIISLPMFIAALPMILVAKANEQQKLNSHLIKAFIATCGLLQWAILAFWGISVFYFSMYEGYLPNQEKIPIIPYLLLAYSVTVAPLNYMASREQLTDDIEKASSLPCFFMQCASAWSVLAIYFDFSANLGPVQGFLCMMAFGFLLTMFDRHVKIASNETRHSNEI